MCMLRYAVLLAALLMTSAFTTNVALAITAQDLMQKMSRDESFGYMSGLIDMRAAIAAQSGDTAFAKCLNDAYYRDKGEAFTRTLLANFEKFPDKQPAAIAYLLIQKMCAN